MPKTMFTKKASNNLNHAKLPSYPLYCNHVKCAAMIYRIIGLVSGCLDSYKELLSLSERDFFPSISSTSPLISCYTESVLSLINSSSFWFLSSVGFTFYKYTLH